MGSNISLPPKVWFTIIPILQMRKLRHKEVVFFDILSQDHTGVDPGHNQRSQQLTFTRGVIYQREVISPAY